MNPFRELTQQKPGWLPLGDSVVLVSRVELGQTRAGAETIRVEFVRADGWQLERRELVFGLSGEILLRNCRAFFVELLEAAEGYRAHEMEHELFGFIEGCCKSPVPVGYGPFYFGPMHPSYVGAALDCVGELRTVPRRSWAQPGGMPVLSIDPGLSADLQQDRLVQIHRFKARPQALESLPLPLARALLITRGPRDIEEWSLAERVALEYEAAGLGDEAGDLLGRLPAWREQLARTERRRVVQSRAEHRRTETRSGPAPKWAVTPSHRSA